MLVTLPGATPELGGALYLGVWSFPGKGTTLLGPGASALVTFGALRTSVGVDAAMGSVSDAAGSVAVRWVTGYVGAGYARQGPVHFGAAGVHVADTESSRIGTGDPLALLPALRRIQVRFGGSRLAPYRERSVADCVASLNR